jgi:hypothetical protein
MKEKQNHLKGTIIRSLTKTVPIFVDKEQTPITLPTNFEFYV